MNTIQALAQLPYERPQPAYDLSDDLRFHLNVLRLHASHCRASAYLEYHAACSILDPNASNSAEDYAIILLRVLGQALGRRAIFLRPGEVELSFDEKWLTSVIGAQMRHDTESLTFLISSRIAQPKRRMFVALISNLVANLSK